jgi:uncharacterized protein
MDKQNPITDALTAKLDALRTSLRDLGSIVVAYSGGVDSAFLLKVAVDELGDKALAVTADSETIPRSELEQARNLAGTLGAKHIVVTTNEMCDPDFVANPPDRCFHCKKTLFGTLTELADDKSIDHVVEGSNASDSDDYRPGMKAVDQFKVHSPLKDAGLTKDEIRALSRELGLPTWDKPAAPCLSSRIPYGSAITSDKLQRIEAAEKYLREQGFKILRVRDHDDVARLEVPREDLPRLLDDGFSAKVTAQLKSLGYRYVTVDLAGFRSGSLNDVLKDSDYGQR